MEKVTLADFVAETLASISDGVRRAQDHSWKNSGVPIAPSTVDEVKLDLGNQLVKFSITLDVQAASAKEGKGQLGGPLVALWAGSIDGQLSQEKRNSSQQVVEFSIPMHFHLRNADERKSKDVVK